MIVVKSITMDSSMNQSAESINDSGPKMPYLTNLKNDVAADKIQLKKYIQAFDKKSTRNEVR